MSALYRRHGAPGLIVYNAVLGAPDQLLSSSVAHLQEAYTVDVMGAIVVVQMAAPAMQAAGSSTIIVTGGGFAHHPIPVLATVAERYWEVVHSDGPWRAEFALLASSNVDRSYCRWPHDTDVRPDWPHVKQSGLEWRSRSRHG
jgi:hypothetical protein